jgi:uncharacterized membrane protein YccF (DUF307 family)
VPGSLSDPDANLVAGAPVSPSEREPKGRYAPPQDRLARIGPEIANIVSDAISQHANEFSDRMTRRSAEIGDRIARRSSQWAERVSQQSERFAERMARRAGTEYTPAQDSWPRRGVVPAPPPRPPVRYALPRQNVPVPARAVWFLLAGCWLSCLWVLTTWVMICLFVFPEAANRMITMIPNVLTLRTAPDPPRSIVPISYYQSPAALVPARLLYMLFVGWWMSLVWMMVAWSLSLTVVGIPISYRMYAVAPAIAHL